MTDDPVRAYLRERGAAELLVAGGLELLVELWEVTARQIERGYDLDLENYLNDMDLRQILDEVLPLAPAGDRASLTARVEEADDRARSRLVDVGRCLWGHEFAAERNLDPAHHWWYFSMPEDRAGEEGWS